MTDPIADLLTRIRNGLMASHDFVRVPYSNKKRAILEILRASGYIGDFESQGEGSKRELVISLSGSKQPQNLTRVSKPGRRVYAGNKEIPYVLGGKGIMVVSTSKGMMTGRQARKLGLGGELICKVW